jgi:predicted SAM-dependent methyltransferase
LIFLKKFSNLFLLKFGLEVQRVGHDKFDMELYQKLYDNETLNCKKFFNVGSGSFFHPYWTNLDFVSDHYKNDQINVVPINLMDIDQLPIPNDYAEVIYCSHVIEHLTDEAVLNVLRESFRCLRPGGVLRITTGPNSDNDYRALMNNDIEWFYWLNHHNKNVFIHHPNQMTIYEKWLHHFASQLVVNDRSSSYLKFSSDDISQLVKTIEYPEILNFFVSKTVFNPNRPMNHINWFNSEKLINFAKDAGFSNAYLSAYGQSVLPILRNTRLFDNTHPKLSIYVEAIK